MPTDPRADSGGVSPTPGPGGTPPVQSGGGLDPLRARRILWRSRRGLLENDILLTRFLEQNLDTLAPDEIEALDALLDLTDRDLLDVLLARPEGTRAPTPAAAALVERIRSDAADR